MNFQHCHCLMPSSCNAEVPFIWLTITTKLKQPLKTYIYFAWKDDTVLVMEFSSLFLFHLGPLCKLYLLILYFSWLFTDELLMQFISIKLHQYAKWKLWFLWLTWMGNYKPTFKKCTSSAEWLCTSKWEKVNQIYVMWCIHASVHKAPNSSIYQDWFRWK